MYGELIFLDHCKGTSCERFCPVGPALEAFGDQRIIFGSSPSPGSGTKSVVGDWYELVKESLAELGIEQEGVDAIFGGNAKKVYERKP